MDNTDVKIQGESYILKIKVFPMKKNFCSAGI
jgi:hypothetical protein